MQNVYDLVPHIERLPARQRATFPEIQDDAFWDHYEVAKRFSLIHVTGFYNVYQSLSYIAVNDVPGDLVECGCFLGGMSIFIVRVCEMLGLERRLHVFDSFAGHPDNETDVMRGRELTGPQYESFLEAVRTNLRENVRSTDAVDLIPGFVEDTVPATLIERIAFLRLDTDFYSSTSVELDHYYPALSEGGVLIVDDYGYFHGSRKATDDYLSTLTRLPLLNRIDEGIWAGVKPGSHADGPASPDSNDNGHAARDELGQRTNELVRRTKELADCRGKLAALEGTLVVRLRNALAEAPVIGSLAAAGASVVRRFVR